MSLPLGQQFSTGDDFALQGLCGNGWRRFWLLLLRVVVACYWRPLGGGQGVAKHPAINTLGKHLVVIWPRMSAGLRLRNSALGKGRRGKGFKSFSDVLLLNLNGGHMVLAL